MGSAGSRTERSRSAYEQDDRSQRSAALPGYQLDDEWIERALQKHDANYAMVTAFESNDPFRLRQLRDYFLTGGGTLGHEFEGHSIHEYEPWEGWSCLNRSTGTKETHKPSEGRLAEDLTDTLADLPRVLTRMDKELRTRSTVFIVHGVRRDTPGVERLAAAVRSWAFSDDLTRNHSLVILFCSATSEILDSETCAQIPIAVVGLGSAREYADLIGRLSSIFGLQHSGEETAALCNSLSGLSLRQAEAILRESYSTAGRFDLEGIKASKGSAISSTGLLDIETPGVGFAGIGGYEAVKDFISRNIVRVLAEPERAGQFAVPLPRGILLFGPPGTGKTLFARALATEIHLPFIRLRTENIYSKWVGETGTNLRNAVQIAEKMSPAIVFIDEVDRFGRRHAADTSAGEEFRRVFSQILEWLGDEKRRAIIVGTTNRPDDMDEAFLRTGRFDYKIPILYPNAAARLEILRIHLGLRSHDGLPSPKTRPPLDLPDSEFLSFLRQQVVPSTELYSGAELEELTRRAKRRAFEMGAKHLSPELVAEALRTFRIDLVRRRNELGSLVEQVRQYCDDAAFLLQSGADER